MRKIKLLIVSDRSEDGSNTDFLANRFKDQFDAKIIYTKSINERTTLFDRILNKINLERDKASINKRIKLEVLRESYDSIIIWKGNRVLPSTLNYIKKISPKTLVCAWCGDNMTKWMNKSFFFHFGLKFYDIIFTVNIPSYKKIELLTNAKVVYFDKRADKYVHKPSSCEQSTFLHDLLFIGTYEKERYLDLEMLAKSGHKITIYGNGWKKVSKSAHNNLDIKCKDITGQSYSDAISRSKIVLGFLRKRNEDTQTSRTFEIPSCGSFMLMERSEDHSRLFVEGVEAEFFDTRDELLQKVNFYITNENRRLNIANNGRNRVVNSGYFFDDLAVQIINVIKNANANYKLQTRKN